MGLLQGITGKHTYVWRDLGVTSLEKHASVFNNYYYALCSCVMGKLYK